MTRTLDNLDIINDKFRSLRLYLLGGGDVDKDGTRLRSLKVSSHFVVVEGVVEIVDVDEQW